MLFATASFPCSTANQVLVRIRNGIRSRIPNHSIHEEQYDQAVEQEEDLQDWPLDDQWDEEALFQEEPGDEDTEDVEEAYATYLDARKRLAEAKLSRGFYPVVALAPGSDGPNPSPSQFPLAAPASKGAKAKGKGLVGKGSRVRIKAQVSCRAKPPLVPRPPHACVVANPAIGRLSARLRTPMPLRVPQAAS